MKTIISLISRPVIPVVVLYLPQISLLKKRGKALMAAQILYTNSFNSSLICSNADKILRFPQSFRTQRVYNLVKQSVGRKLSVQCSENQIQTLRTCKNCKTQFDPSLNDPRACRYHTAHFGGNPIYTLLLFFLSFFFFLLV